MLKTTFFKAVNNAADTQRFQFIRAVHIPSHHALMSFQTQLGEGKKTE